MMVFVHARNSMVSKIRQDRRDRQAEPTPGSIEAEKRKQDVINQKVEDEANADNTIPTE